MKDITETMLNFIIPPELMDAMKLMNEFTSDEIAKILIFMKLANEFNPNEIIKILSFMQGFKCAKNLSDISKNTNEKK